LIDFKLNVLDDFRTRDMVKRLTPVVCLIALCWAVFVLNNLILHGNLNQYGIRPRHMGDLPSILWAPFLHGSWKHLFANTLPLALLGAILSLRSRTEFGIVTVAGIFLSGALTWLIGRNAYHIGASGLIFCFFGYLASLAFFERRIGTLLLSIVCILGYGGIVRGILPTSSTVSWEGHLAGFISGIALAWFLSRVKEADTDGKPEARIPKSERNPKPEGRI
jgi:membrane associated rhomboid family serine protease